MLLWVMKPLYRQSFGTCLLPFDLTDPMSLMWRQLWLASLSVPQGVESYTMRLYPEADSRSGGTWGTGTGGSPSPNLRSLLV